MTESLSQLPAEIYDERIAKARSLLQERESDTLVLFNSYSIEYLTGFNHIQTERPVILALNQEEIRITVPRLEVERVSEVERINQVHSYFDYPQGKPIKTASEMIDKIGSNGVLADSEGAPGTMGYSGPSLSQFKDLETEDFISEWRKTKSNKEVALIRESAKWGKKAHEAMEDMIAPGKNAVKISDQASMKVSQEMMKDHGEEYADRSRYKGAVSAGIIGGKQTRLPHAHNTNRELKEGDTIISGATANADGYYSELERTMFVKEASKKQKQRFNQMMEAQQTAIEACGPRVPISQVAEEVYSYFKEQGVEEYVQHHVGHNIGLQGHEPPFIDRGTEGKMKPGHVWTLEPGLYTENNGYRHSDTILITENGTELITQHPRNLEYNIIR